MRILLFGLVLAVSAGCGNDVGPSEVDEAAVLKQVAQFKKSGFVRINSTPRKSVHMDADIHVWVSEESAEAYRAVDSSSEAVAALPRGTVVVKEQLNAQGEVEALTVMSKGPAGYHPEAGDWYFAQTNPQGEVNDGVSGKVGFCVDCHSPRAASDWVFGVPKDEQQ